LVKDYLTLHGVHYASPSATPAEDGEHLSEYSQKWAAIHAGLGFIGKNDVFVHYMYGQRVRISVILVDLYLPCFTGEITSRCGSCRMCVDACPHGYIAGQPWHINTQRNDLLDYKACASQSNPYGKDSHPSLCGDCLFACLYHRRA